MPKKMLFATTLFLASIFDCGLAKSTGGLRQRRDSTSSDLLCRIARGDLSYETATQELETEDFHVCSPVIDDSISPNFYRIDLPQPIIDQYRDHFTTHGADGFIVSVPNGEVHADLGEIHKPDTSEITVVETPEGLRGVRRRRLAPRSGVLTAVVFRILATDRNPSPLSSEYLRYAVFDKGGSMVDQYARCSNENLQIVPKSDQYSVVDVVLDDDYSHGRRDVLYNNAYNAALRKIKNEFGERSIDYIHDWVDLALFMFPQRGNWLAYAYVGLTESVYNGSWGGFLTNQMHEVGHNFGLWHAHEGGVAYAHYSGFMGGFQRSVHYTTDGPYQCFNPANYGYLGWSDDKKVTLAQNNRFEVVRMVPFVDYDIAVEQQSVLVEIQFGRNFNPYFSHYNRAKDYNSGTAEYANMILITQLAPDATHHIAALQATVGASYTQVIDGEDWRVEVCEKKASTGNDDAEVLYVAFGYSSDSLCDGWVNPDAVPPPTSAPVTPLPSALPTFPPTHSPTFAPTSHPTSEPQTCALPGEACNAEYTCCGNRFCLQGFCRPNRSQSQQMEKVAVGRQRGTVGNRRTRERSHRRL